MNPPGDSKPAGFLTLAARSWAVSWPMTVIMLFEFVMSMTDVYAAGRIGKEVQAAYGLVLQIYFMAIIVGNALTVGSVSVISRLHGTGDPAPYRVAVRTTFLAACAAGAIFAAAGVAAGPLVIRALHVPPEVVAVAAPLFTIYAAGFLFHYVLFSNNGTLRASGLVRTSLRAQALVCAVKVPLTFLLVFHTPLGYSGLGLATVAAVVTGAAVTSLAVRPLWAGAARVSRAVIAEIASVGWPAGLMQLLWQLGFTTLYLVVSDLPLHRVETLAAFSNGLRIESAIFLPAFAFNMANAVIIGNLIGAGRRDEAHRAGLATAAMGVAIVAVLTVAIVAAAPLIAGLLSAHDVVRAETARYLSIALLAEPVMAFGVILAGALNGAGDTRSVMLAVTVAMWVVRLPLAWLLGIRLELGASAIWWSMNASVACQALLVSIRYFRRRWLPES